MSKSSVRKPPSVRAPAYTRFMHDAEAAARDAGPVIQVTGLAKEYRVFDKPEGLAASVRALFHRTSRVVEALRGVDLAIELEQLSFAVTSKLTKPTGSAPPAAES